MLNIAMHTKRTRNHGKCITKLPLPTYPSVLCALYILGMKQHMATWATRGIWQMSLWHLLQCKCQFDLRLMRRHSTIYGHLRSFLGDQRPGDLLPRMNLAEMKMLRYRCSALTKMSTPLFSPDNWCVSAFRPQTILMMLLTTMICMKAGRVRVTTGQGTQLLRQRTLYQYLRKNSPGMRGLANVASLNRDWSKTSTSERTVAAKCRRPSENVRNPKSTTKIHAWQPSSFAHAQVS